MGRADFLRVLEPITRLAVDTSSAIYYLGQDPKRFALSRDAFDCAARGKLEVLFAGITQMELLVRPFREHDALGKRRVMTLVEGTPGVRTVPLSRDVLVTAAEVRALTNLKTPDSLVAASALVHGCDAIVGNDRAFGRLAEVSSQEWTMFDVGARPVPTYIHLDDFVD